jgi:hypothetical protein
LPSSPTPNEEKTCRNGGRGGGNAWRMVRFQAHARATTESRLSRIPTITQRQLTKSKA